MTDTLKVYQLKRLWNWRSQFISWLSACRADAREGKLKFSWDPSQGSDCMSFCGEAVMEITGFDLYKTFLNGQTYNDAVSAYKVIMSQQGVNNIDQLLRSLLPEKSIESVHSGDLVSIRVNDNTLGRNAYAGGVAAPPYVYVVTPEGLGRGNLKTAVSGFAVG